ncbi:uncharacterized protein LOC105695477 [Orussus abietinus]|uniref:uncharacterized protein LOC105695477 n=1 Tax=Orussus abietinus TaxID=222816 RepID=UPI000626C16C|nr:uncharacterized protein LOC105695477 [Orussus abietinus]
MITCTDNVCILMGLSMVCLKTVNAHLYRGKIGRLVEEANGCVAAIRERADRRELRLMRRYFLQTDAIFYFTLIIAVALVVGFVILVPVELKYPFDVSDPWNRSLVLGFQAFVVTVDVLATDMLDNLFSRIYASIVLRLQILNLRFEDCAVGGGLAARLEACVRRHQGVLRSVAEVNEVYSGIGCMQFVVVSVINCIALFQMFLNVGRNPNFLKFGAYYGGSLFYICCYCWISDRITHQSSLVIDSQWMAGWERDPSPTVKSLMIFSAMVANKPLTMKIWRFGDFSLATAINTLRISYSAYTLLTRVHENDEP